MESGGPHRACLLNAGHGFRRFGLAAERRRPWTLQTTSKPCFVVKSLQGNVPERQSPSDESAPSIAAAMSGLPPIPPVPRVGTCVQVPHQSFLDMGPTSDRFWTLVTHTLVPGPDRRDMAILLACLESLYRAEYQQLAGEAITAIAAANNAHVRPDGSVADLQLTTPPEPGLELALDVNPPAPPPSPHRRQQGQQEHPLGGTEGVVNGTSTATQDEREAGGSGGALPSVAAAAAAAAAALVRSYGMRAAGVDAATAADGSVDEGDAATSRPGLGTAGGGAASAVDLDSEALRQLLRLAQRAGYQPLTVRDVRLADSLNADYLSQLFIKGSTRRLDGALVQDYVDSELPAEARPVLLLQRGYGRELQAGRLLLQKLDYLQTLAVGQAGSWAGGAAAVLAAVLFGTFEEGGPGGPGGAPPFLSDTLAGAGNAAEAADSGAAAAAAAPAVTEAAAAAASAGGPESRDSSGRGDGERSVRREVEEAAEGFGAQGWEAGEHEGQEEEGGQVRGMDVNDAPEATAAAATRMATGAAGAAAVAVGGTEVAAGAELQSQRHLHDKDLPPPRDSLSRQDGDARTCRTDEQISTREPRRPVAIRQDERRRPWRRQHPEHELELEPVQSAASAWLEDEAISVPLGRQTDGTPVAGPSAAAEAGAAATERTMWGLRARSGASTAAAGAVRVGRFRGAALAAPPESTRGAGPAPAVATEAPAGVAEACSGGGMRRRGVASAWTEAETQQAAAAGAGARAASLALAAASAPAKADEDVLAERRLWGSAASGDDVGGGADGSDLTSGLSSPSSDLMSSGAWDSWANDELCNITTTTSGGGVGNGSWDDGLGGQYSNPPMLEVGDGAAGLASVDEWPAAPLSLWSPSSPSTTAPTAAGGHEAVAGAAPPTNHSDCCHDTPTPGVPGPIEDLQRGEAAGELTEAASEMPTPPLSPPTGPWTTALAGVYSVLSDWGLVPRTDIIPLTAFNSYFPVHERPGRQPLLICKVSLGDALGGANWLRGGVRGLLDGLLREVQLQEPTFREVLVLYRPAHNRMAPSLEHRSPGLGLWQQQLQQQLDVEKEDGAPDEARDGAGAGGAPAAAPAAGVGPRRRRRVKRGLGAGWLRRLWARWRGVEEEPAVRRPPIQIRMYRDIPIPTWKVVLPEKLLQFRPLDLLRVDLFALAGLAGLAAQARYDSVLVDVITFGSATVLLVRIILGYQRMADRFRSVVNELLAEKALAGQEGAVEALAMAAAQQQLRQAALAYVLLLHHCRPGAVDQLAAVGGGGGAAAATFSQQEVGPGGWLEGVTASPASSSTASSSSLCAAMPPAMATTSQLQELAEWALAHHSGVRVRFNACQALHELQRLGLVVRVASPDSDSSNDEDDDDDDGCDVTGGVINSSAADYALYGSRASEINGQPRAAAEAAPPGAMPGTDVGTDDGPRTNRAGSGALSREGSGCGCASSAGHGAAAQFGGEEGREEEGRVGGAVQAAAGNGAAAGGVAAADGQVLPLPPPLPPRSEEAAADPFSIRISVDIDGRGGGAAAGGGPAGSWRRGSGGMAPDLGASISSNITDITDTIGAGGGGGTRVSARAGTAPGPGLGAFPTWDGDDDSSGSLWDPSTDDGCSGAEGCEDPFLGCDGAEGCGCADVWWAAVPLRDAVPVVEDHWAGLLWRRVKAILRRRDGL